ncbi:hypothetical protein SLG_34450 [Sphingobium sp. SYK-6]|uniref:hypothetical protein n=1 Tax=Sphingobium sp. (strain NBRC 103272 / SYK-6) TaxID=627192 RepID=UPI0002277A0C|nr:hypothetical protein [Sphingobium sp. SYK-6]BAK68120.1 hypothetical protein SLG_34450 [Sphingobium sp. SYK-6]
MSESRTDGPGIGGETAEAAARRAAAAKQRFFIISLFRLSGAIILIFGMAISLQRFGWVQGDKAKWMGLIISIVGFVQFMIVPRMLARAFATPRERGPGRP